MNIEEIIIKTLIAVELKITAAMDMFVAYPGNLKFCNWCIQEINISVANR